MNVCTLPGAFCTVLFLITHIGSLLTYILHIFSYSHMIWMGYVLIKLLCLERGQQAWYSYMEGNNRKVHPLKMENSFLEYKAKFPPKNEQKAEIVSFLNSSYIIGITSKHRVTIARSIKTLKEA